MDGAAEVTALNEFRRRALGRNLRALVYSMLIAASVNNAYTQIFFFRAMDPRTIVITGDADQRREIAGLELFLMSVAKTRFCLISALVLCVVLVLVMSPTFARLRRTQLGSLAWLVPGGSALGAIAALALDQMRFPLAVGSSSGMVLGGISAGGFLAFYLTNDSTSAQPYRWPRQLQQR